MSVRTYAQNVWTFSVQSMVTISVVTSTSFGPSWPVLLTILYFTTDSDKECACLAKARAIQRANYQTAIWRRSFEGPSPHNQGWLVESGSIAVDWTDQRPAPDFWKWQTAVAEQVARRCDVHERKAS